MQVALPLLDAKRRKRREKVALPFPAWWLYTKEQTNVSMNKETNNSQYSTCHIIKINQTNRWLRVYFYTCVLLQTTANKPGIVREAMLL